MFTYLLTTAMAVLAVATPIRANGLHDFNPALDKPSATTTSSKQGNCYSTTDNSRLCYFQNYDGSYSLAIHDTDYPSYPIALNINCRTGNYRGYGTAPNEQMKLWATVFCRDL